MKCTTKTVDPAGTAVSVIGGAGCALFGFLAFGPIGALVMGVIAGVGTKKECTKQTSQELDEIASKNSDEMAEIWLSQPGGRSATVSTTKYTGALISLPQTRIRHYTKEDGEELVIPTKPFSFEDYSRYSKPRSQYPLYPVFTQIDPETKTLGDENE
jgi:hypothetical protein